MQVNNFVIMFLKQKTVKYIIKKAIILNQFTTLEYAFELSNCLKLS